MNPDPSDLTPFGPAPAPASAPALDPRVQAFLLRHAWYSFTPIGFKASGLTASERANLKASGLDTLHEVLRAVEDASGAAEGAANGGRVWTARTRPPEPARVRVTIEVVTDEGAGAVFSALESDGLLSVVRDALEGYDVEAEVYEDGLCVDNL